MQVYESDSALGYLQISYFLKIEDRRFLCIDSINNTHYVEGSVYIFEDYEIQKSDRDIKKSPLYGTYLFGVVVDQLHRLQFNHQILVSKKDF